MTIPLTILIQNNDERAQVVVEVLSANSSIEHVLRFRTAVSARKYMLSNEFPRRLPGLIFLENHLPDIPGMTLLRELKSNPLTKAIPVVVLGGGDSRAEAALAYCAGANLYVPRPASPGDFAIAMTELSLMWTNTARVAAPVWLTPGALDREKDEVFRWPASIAGLRSLQVHRRWAMNRASEREEVHAPN